MDITITIPQKGFGAWLQEANFAKSNGYNLYYRVPTRPRGQIFGHRAYIIHMGRIIGYHIIKEFKDCPDGFICDITGIEWPPGKYILRDGATFTYLKNPMPAESHRGYRYWRGDKLA